MLDLNSCPQPLWVSAKKATRPRLIFSKKQQSWSRIQALLISPLIMLIDAKTLENCTGLSTLITWSPFDHTVTLGDFECYCLCTRFFRPNRRRSVQIKKPYICPVPFFCLMSTTRHPGRHSTPELTLGTPTAVPGMKVFPSFGCL